MSGDCNIPKAPDLLTTRQDLTPEAYAVCILGGTEAPSSGAYYACFKEGVYHCICCDDPLFDSRNKYDSGSGWPSFWAPINHQSLTLRSDPSHGMQRREVRCNNCDAHLGHVFSDGPDPTGMRYCINSVALKLRTRDPKA